MAGKLFALLVGFLGKKKLHLNPNPRPLGIISRR